MENLAKKVEEITRGAGAILLGKFKKINGYKTKENEADIVTEADELADAYVIQQITKYFPDHGIISEETGETLSAVEYQWLIDPLDSTRNFSTRIPIFATMLSIVQAGEPLMAAVFDPVHDEFLFAERGKGAYLNGIPVFCSQRKEVSYSYGIVATGPSVFSQLETELNRSAEQAWTSKYASISHAILAVADARRDWVVGGFSGGVWDYTPGYVILKEAGCTVTRLSGAAWQFGDTEILAANPRLHESLLPIIGKSKV